MKNETGEVMIQTSTSPSPSYFLAPVQVVLKGKTWNRDSGMKRKGAGKSVITVVAVFVFVQKNAKRKREAYECKLLGKSDGTLSHALEQGREKRKGEGENTSAK